MTMPALPALPQADLLQPGGYPLTIRFATVYHRYSSEEPDQIGRAAEEKKMTFVKEALAMATFIAAMVLLLAAGSMR